MGGQDVELLDHVLRLAAIAHHEAVARDAAVGADQEQVAEAPAGQRVVDDLAVHLPPVELAERQDLLQRHAATSIVIAASCSPGQLLRK